MKSFFKMFACASVSAVLATMTLGVPALAQDSGAVDIEASEMEVLETDKLAIFRGDVVARRPSDTIRCQEMTVNYADAKGSDGSDSSVVERIDCKGNVSVVTDSQKITGDTARFFMLKDELLVTGNVMVVQGKTVLRGPQLTVDLKTRRTRMSGGRVKGKFVPK
jgi:lipopolysaccharide export system protein LptA